MSAHDLWYLAVETVIVLLWLIVPVSCAGQSDSERPSREVTREVEEAAEAIRDYSIDQKDEAVRQGRRAIEDIDLRMRALRQRIDEHWNEMEPEAQSQARDTLESLRARRNEAARWLDELRASSAGTWDEVKRGFVRSYGDLRTSFEKAGKRY